MGVPVQTKNQRRREKAKAKKQEAKQSAENGNLKDQSELPIQDTTNEATTPDEGPDDGGDAEIQITTADLNPDDPLYQQYKGILAQFQEEEPTKTEHVHYEDEEDNIPDEEVEAERDEDDDDDEDEDETATKKPLSKTKRRKAKISVAELKSNVARPDQVEWYDVSAKEPRVTVAIKSSRNMVPIPSHWSVKREYLSNKRGIEKTPFALPKFIADTGITAMRDAALDRQSKQSMKQKQRERVAPKMGKLDVDYSKLFEAFFKFQEKPTMSRYGEIYYEGKEWESDYTHLKPGDLSEDLKEALGMPLGAPPPWLLNQQRYGGPKGYPNLKIPGLNAPIPLGAEWGFHPGGWGKPTVDEHNRPVAGFEVFASNDMKKSKNQPHEQEKALKLPPRSSDKSTWGQLIEVEEDPDEEEEEDEDEDDEEAEQEEEVAPKPAKSAKETTKSAGRPDSRSGAASTGQTAFASQNLSEDFTLRKDRLDATKPRSAGQILKESSVDAKGFFGSDRRYEIPTDRMLGQEDGSKKRKAGDIDVSVDLDRLEREGKLSKDEMAKMYSSGKEAEQNPQWGRSQLDQQDLDDMIAEESNKRRKKEDANDRRRRG